MFGVDILWILVAAIGARGLAMALNRIIDKDIDATNPRTENRHLVSGSLSMNTVWTLATVFLVMLLFGAWQLNEIAFMMAWLPVIVFVIYPYTKRYTWLCHFWLGLCLGLASPPPLGLPFLQMYMAGHQLRVCMKDLPNSTCILKSFTFLFGSCNMDCFL